MSMLPEAFQNQIQKQLGAEASAFFRVLEEQASPTSLRINPLKNFSMPDGRFVPWSSMGRYLEQRPVFTLDPHFHAGQYYVQEASSMFLEFAVQEAVDLNESLTVLDLCASPGGKSTHLISLMNDTSFLVSNEVIRSRANILSENIQKWGYPNVMVTNNDPSDFSKLKGSFDLIVVDAPCSGEGLFRKDPDAVKEWSPDNVLLCASRQQRILHDVWPSLKENGILIYCTCTYNDAENESNLHQFSKENSVEFLELHPDSSWNILKVEKENVVGYKFFPHKVEGEGFFLSVMKKKDVSGSITRKSRKKINEVSKKHLSVLQTWVKDPGKYSINQHNDLAYLIPSSRVADIEFFLEHLKMIYMGTNLATIKHEKLIPEHSLAVSTVINTNNFEILDLSESQALQYLRRETLLPLSDKTGFTLVQFEKSNLGWVNVLPNRINNLYPQEWRIRMAAL